MTFAKKLSLDDPVCEGLFANIPDTKQQHCCLANFNVPHIQNNVGLQHN